MDEAKKWKALPKLFRDVVQSIPAAVIALDIEGRVHLWNLSAERIFGWSSEEVLGKPLPTIPESEKVSLSKEARESLAGEVHLQKPCRRQCKDGTLLDVTLSTAPLRSSDGSIHGTVGFLLDVTETRKTEKQLERTHNLLQATFAGMDEAVFVVDPKDRTIVTANPAVERIFGYSEKDVIGRNTVFLHPNPEAYEEWHRVSSQELNRHGVVRSEWYLRRKNGELFWAEITVRPISGNETWQRGVVSVIRDISERKTYTDELNKKSRDLGERVKELNCLFAAADLLNDPHSSLENVLQSVIETLPPGFQFPRNTCARLTLDGSVYTSGDFEETPWRLSSRLQSDHSKGLIEVCYREKTPAEADGPFLDEERRMLDGVAERIGSFLQRREAIGDLRALRKRLQHLLTASPGIIFSASVIPPYRTTFISENVGGILGYEPNQFIEDPEFWIGQIHPQDRSKIENALEDVSPDQTVTNEYRFQHRDGSWRWMLDFSRLMTDEEGHPVEYIGSLVDITQRKEAEAELRRLNQTLLMVSRCNEALVRSRDEKELLESILHHLVDSGDYSIATVWFVGEEDEGSSPAVYPEKAAEFLSERDDEESDLLERLSRVCLQAFSGEIFTTEELFTQCPECRKFAAIFDVHSVFALPLKLKEDNIGCLTLFNPRSSFSSEEVKLLKELADDLAYGIRALRTEAAHRLAEKSLRVRNRAMEASSNGIMISEAKFPEMPIIYVNPAFERITGYSAEDVMGLNPRFLSTGDQKQKGLVDIRTALKEGEQAEALVRNYRKDGSLFWNDFSVAPVPNNAGETTHYIGIINDVTDLKQYEKELERKANFDELTGLPNRNLLADRLQQGIALADRHKGALALLLIDLDRFHIINASMGHHMGNELLKEVAKRLRSRVRSQDTLARLGADEFVLLLQDVQAPDALNAVVEKVRSTLDPPFTLGARRLSITTSIGIAMYPLDGPDGDALIRNAGIAKFHAKKSERDTFRFFTKEMSTRVVETMDLEADLRLALEREEFLLHFQPKVEVATNRIIGCEALVRWKHPERGLVSPGEFIPLAEQTGLIEPLGEWILMEACKRNRSWQDHGLPAIPMAVNVSARQFRNEEFVDTVEKILQESGLASQWLDIELTESMLMENPESAVQIMKRLKELGLGLDLDDFGTGYSSLSYLQRFPVDRLKIDRSFISEVTTDPDNAAVASSIVAVAHNLKLNVVAEGVETEEQLEFLRNCNCNAYQGFLFSRPVPAEEFKLLLQNQ